MSDTAFIIRGHLTKWQMAYIRLSLYVASMVVPLWLKEFRQYKEFGDITPIAWLIIGLETISLAVIAIIAFLDKSAPTKSDNPQNPQ